jgi:uncharacterized cupredoxin-like copper-binding protein
MNPLRRLVVALVVASLGALSAVALSACGDDGGDSDRQVDVSLTERDLTPGRVDVRAGEVEFVVENDGERIHEFAVETGDGTIKRTDAINPGETDRITVDLADGKYEMYDPRGGYRSRGVSGTVVVGSDRANTVTERTVTERTVESDTVEAPPPADPAVTETQTETQVQPPTPAPAPAPAPAPTVTEEVPAPPPMTSPTTP